MALNSEESERTASRLADIQTLVQEYTAQVILGEADLEVLKPIVRCAATHVDPATGERDVEVVKGLFDNYGHMFCGVYASVTRGGAARIGDAAACLAVAAAA